MMFLLFPFFLIPFALFWVVRPGAGMGWCDATHAGYAQGHAPNASGVDPMTIAGQRLARGEINAAEFEEIRRAIG